jgi:hypothetical protein
MESFSSAKNIENKTIYAQKAAQSFLHTDASFVISSRFKTSFFHLAENFQVQ